MKYLITGAAGFVGSHLSARLRAAGNVVLGLDNYSPYYSPQLKELRVAELLTPLGVEVRNIDLAELNSFKSAVKEFRPDTVIHLAAQPGVRTPLGKSYQYIQNNVVAFSNVLQICIEEKISEFLYASSSSVYGNSLNIPYREDDLTIRPISIYGATKLSNEILTPAFINGSNTRARGMRFFTVYGPWGRPDMAYFRLIDSALNGSEFRKFGGGEVKRDFTFIDDITTAIENLSKELATRPEGYSDIVNIGGGKPHSLNDLIMVISQQIPSKLNTTESLSNPNDTIYTNADVTLLKELTNIVPNIDLQNGVTRTISWAMQEKIREKLTTWTNSTI
ncbi:WcaG Nucleoside-diphosphate-sugar epimerases [Candidatus Nanopelagicaceae bacterium]